MSNVWVKSTEVAGIYPAIKGMRNALDSWGKSDSYITPITNEVIICEKDMILAKKLINAGGEHRKFLRQIQVWCDIQLPRYIWQELDTYKFGVKNSRSTMHTIMKKEITIEDFYLGESPSTMTKDLFEYVVSRLNYLRGQYLSTKDYDYVKQMKRILPESFLQMRTWNTNYEELLNVYKQRRNHKLNDEWSIVIKWIENLPFFREMCLTKI